MEYASKLLENNKKKAHNRARNKHRKTQIFTTQTTYEHLLLA
jgi:hypothetical protein